MQRQTAKTKIGILYGGRSGEHNVSLCSAASVVSALDSKKYDVTAIGIDRDGRWYVLPILSQSSFYVLKLHQKKACKKFAMKWKQCLIFSQFCECAF